MRCVLLNQGLLEALGTIVEARFTSSTDTREGRAAVMGLRIPPVRGRGHTYTVWFIWSQITRWGKEQMSHGQNSFYKISVPLSRVILLVIAG